MSEKDQSKFRFAELPKQKTANQDYRSEYRRDYARVIHSAAFRRLQNKTQLFPGQEDDFFRNRLTHSLEVAQIAKTVAQKLLCMHPELPIEPDVCEIAGIIHDIGHPPFGHNGEKALNDCMSKYGGFEGNAQSLRIVTRLEKTEKYAEELFDELGNDNRKGLNLTARVIASALKYDNCIPVEVGEEVVKGYYASEKNVVGKVKECVLGSQPLDAAERFKTIECSIMDLADDIAYSTYDVEDAFKAGFISPLEMITADDYILGQIVDKLKRDRIDCSIKECRTELLAIFAHVWQHELSAEDSVSKIRYLKESHTRSQQTAKDGYLRTQFTSFLVNNFISGIEVRKNEKYPTLSEVKFKKETLLRVNILKHFSYVCLINSPRLKVAESRGQEIVSKLFEKIDFSEGRLLPDDFQEIYRLAEKTKKTERTQLKKRVVCDFIAGMTDRYALEFFGRLYSENPQTIFKPF